ncbi:hypothetical protein J4461_04045 [Candidatus Pacearchaeota archaeon]|nr:hypothetical protein [Candidatus Pacearchaeota archaeon]
MESEIIQLIARDRLEIPLSSMYQKVKRVKKKDAGNLAEKLGSAQFAGERTYAFVESEDKERARGMKEAIAEFAQEFPKYGQILIGKIAERRVIAEEHLYFGVNPGCRLTTDDYITALQSTGLSEKVSRELYPDLIKVSRKLAKASEEKRSVIVGKYAQD